MVVCKFFQEGSCRYGQNCRFEHVYSSKYSYHANAPAQAASTGGLTDEQLVHQIRTDVQSALKGGQWLLSYYAPFKEKPIFPGLSDLSPEEARLFIYEAKANNNLDQAVAYMNNLMKEARSKYEQLLTTTPNIVKVIRSIYKGESPPSPFTNGQIAQNVFGPQSSNATSVFRSANQQTTPFGQNNSNIANQGFGQTPAQSIFSQANANTAKSLFSQATQNVFGAQPTPNQNIFGAQPTQNQNLFGAQPAQNQNLFGAQPAQNQNVFGVQPNSNQNLFGAQPAHNQNVFGAQPAQNQNVFGTQPAQNQNVFGTQDTAKSLFSQASQGFGMASQSQPTAQPFKSPFDQPSPFAQNTSSVLQNSQTSASGFGQTSNVFQQTASDDPGVYSKESDLTNEYLEMYKAESFKLGFIPEMPPPHSLCV